MKKRWTKAEKAQWILEHGEPNFVWIYERAGTEIYRRPSRDMGVNLPPWISTNRQKIESCVGHEEALFHFATFNETKEIAVPGK